MKERILDLYRSGLSCKTISQQVGLNINAVYKLVKDADIARSRTEALQKYVKYGVCEICGREFRMRDKWNSTTSHHRRTCSNECESELRSKSDSEAWTDERKEHMRVISANMDRTGWNVASGDRKPNWKGGLSSTTYRRIAKDFGLKWECVLCGSLKQICVHHKDRDKTNNTLENLVILCKPCHTRHHIKMGESGGWNHLKHDVA